MTDMRTLRRNAEAAEFRRFYASLIVEENTLEEENTLGRLNEMLFEEMRNLQAIDVADSEALAAEVERSRAVDGIAKTVIQNANTLLEATRMRAQFVHDTRMPRMLEG